MLTSGCGGTRQIDQVDATNRPGVRIEQIVQLTGRLVRLANTADCIDTLEPDAELGVIAPATAHEHVVRLELQFALAAIVEHIEQQVNVRALKDMGEVGAELVLDEGLRAADVVLAGQAIAWLNQAVALARAHQALVHRVERGRVALALTRRTLALFEHHEQAEHAELVEEHVGRDVFHVAVPVVHLHFAAAAARRTCAARVRGWSR